MRAHPIALLAALLGPSALLAQPVRPVTVVLCVEGDPTPEAAVARALQPTLGGARLRVVGEPGCPTAGHVGRFELAGGRVVFRLRAPGDVLLHRTVGGLTGRAQPLSELQAAGQLSTFGVQLYGLLLEARAERTAAALPPKAQRPKPQISKPPRRRRPARRVSTARQAQAPRLPELPVRRPPPPVPPVPLPERPPPPPEASVLRRPPPPLPPVAEVAAPATATPPKPARLRWAAEGWGGVRWRSAGWAPSVGLAGSVGPWGLAVEGEPPADGRWQGLPVRQAAVAAWLAWQPSWRIGRAGVGPVMGLGGEGLWLARRDVSDPGGHGWQPVAAAGARVYARLGRWRLGLRADGRAAWPAWEGRSFGGEYAAVSPWSAGLALSLGWAP